MSFAEVLVNQRSELDRMMKLILKPDGRGEEATTLMVIRLTFQRQKKGLIRKAKAT